jgi:hypothetical protein
MKSRRAVLLLVLLLGILALVSGLGSAAQPDAWKLS